MGFPSGSDVKNLPVMQETPVRPLGWEDPLEKGMATHPRILAWKIPWPGEPDGLQSMGSQRVRHNSVTFTLVTIEIVLEGQIAKHSKTAKIQRG